MCLTAQRLSWGDCICLQCRRKWMMFFSCKSIQCIPKRCCSSPGPCRGFDTDKRLLSSRSAWGPAELSRQSCTSLLWETVGEILSPWSFISVWNTKVLDNQASGKRRISVSQVSDAVAREKCTYWTHKNSQLAALVSWGEIDMCYLFVWTWGFLLCDWVFFFPEKRFSYNSTRSWIYIFLSFMFSALNSLIEIYVHFFDQAFP